MLKNLREFGVNSIIYGLGRTATKLLAFLLLPIYTRYLSPEEYGLLALITTTSTIVAIIARLGIDQAIVWAIKSEEHDISKSISTAIIFHFIEGIIVFMMIGLIFPHISLLILGSEAYTYLFQIALASLLLNAISLIFLSTLQIQEKAKLYAFFTVIQFIVITFFKILFIVVLEMGIEGIIYSDLIVTALFSCVYLVYLRKYIKLSVSWIILRKMLRFGMPLIITGLSTTILTSADRYFLQAYSTARDVGLYSLGYNMGLAILIVIHGVQRAWPLQFIKISKQVDAPQQLSLVSTYYFVFIAFLGLIIAIFSREAMIILTTEEYYDASIVVPLVVASYILYGLQTIVNVGVWIHNKNQYLIPITLVAVLLNIILNFVLIPQYGMLGAAWATIFSYATIVGLELVINRRFYPIPYEYTRIFQITIACFVIYLLSTLLGDTTLLIAISVKLVLLLLYPVLLLLFGFYSAKEKQRIIRVVRSVIAR